MISDENIHALTITVRFIPARFRIMLAGRANHRNDGDDPRASFYPVPGSDKLGGKAPEACGNPTTPHMGGRGSTALPECMQGQKHEILLHAKGRGERGGCDLLKGRLISWVNPRPLFLRWAALARSQK